MDLSNNTLTGSIPKHLGNITNISQLFLDNNQLFDQTFFLFRANMAHNDEAGGSGGKAFWELSQEMEEQPHLYEAAAFPTRSEEHTSELQSRE